MSLRALRRTAAVVAVCLASTTLTVDRYADAAPATPPTAGNAAPTSGHDGLLGTRRLRRLLLGQPLPQTHLLPTTATSHPWNGAAWQNVPIDLAAHGYVEREYTLHGTANVYDWAPDGHYRTSVLRSGDYTTRLDVRRPRDMSTWSGHVVVEIINMSAGYDWTAIWSSLWQRVLHDHDVYVGVTSKPNVLPSLQRFDPQRYRALSWANPLPVDEQTCGSTPGATDEDLNLSRRYENGLVWDLLTQTGRLLKSRSPANPLGRPASQVLLSGESQSSSFLLTYYRYFTPAAVLPGGRPVFDGMFAETLVGVAGNLDALGLYGDRINQCAQALPADDPQVTAFPARSVPWLGINSDWDYPGVRGWTAPPDSDTRSARRAFWEVAGSNHGWEWQYDDGDADATDLVKAGFTDPATYDWSCGPNNPEVPFYIPEKAAYEHLQRWSAGGAPPPRAPRILTTDSGSADTTWYDPLGNAMGGLRLPMVDVPVASFGPGQYALTPGCPEITTFRPAVLRALYPDRASYLADYRASTDQLIRRGFVLPEDRRTLTAIAERVTAVR